MHSVRKTILIAGAIILVVGCATDPVGPSVRVLPAPYKPFEVYQRDVAECQRYAGDQTRGGAQAANNRAIGSVLLGAALGAAIGAAATGEGQAAALGAAAGGAAGTLYGSNQSQWSQYGLQGRYDEAYAQCMYAKGNQVPGYYGSSGAPPPPPPPPGQRPPARSLPQG